MKYSKEHSDSAREMYTKYLEKYAADVIRHILEKPNAEVEKIMNFPYPGSVSEAELLEIIDFSANKELTEITALLINYKHEYFSCSDDNKEE